MVLGTQQGRIEVRLGRVASVVSDMRQLGQQVEMLPIHCQT